ncbi:hypothetical protein R6Q59_027945 [Mikania micrantha]
MAPGSLNNVVDGVGIVYGRGSVSCAANRQRSLRRQNSSQQKSMVVFAALKSMIKNEQISNYGLPNQVDFLMGRKWVVAAALHRYVVDQEMGGLMLFHALLVKLFKRVFVSGLAWFCYVSFKEMIIYWLLCYSSGMGHMIPLSSGTTGLSSPVKDTVFVIYEYSFGKMEKV